MIKAKRNQLANVTNQYQGTVKKVLCVCSAGLLRSPTIASFLNKEYGYNTRAVGVGVEYALIPISDALVYWADLIVCAEKSHERYIRDNLPNDSLPPIISLDIEDDYGYNQPELVDQIRNKLNNLIKENK
jgi:predicted protein tyrosine phosphatase